MPVVTPRPHRPRLRRPAGRTWLRLHRGVRPVHRPAPTAHDPEVVRARWSLMGMFAVFGVISSSWLGRLPSVREGLGVDAGQLGMLLVVGAGGSLLGISLTGTAILRLGSRATLRVGMVGALVGFLLIGLGVAVGSVPVFALGVLLNGLTAPATNVSVNFEATRVERRMGKAVLPHMHAALSVGAAVGTGLAAVTSVLALPVAVHIVGVAVLVTAARLALIAPGTALQDAPTRSGGAAAGSRRRGMGAALAPWTERRTVLIGLVLLAATLSEGAAANWLNLAVVDGFAVPEALGAAAYGTFVLAMVTVRLAGATLIARLGRVTVLRVSGASALVGLLAFGLSPSIVTAWVGIALWGMGAALAYPVGTAAAADDPTKAAARVSVVGSFGSIASLSAPPVLGLLANAWGTRHALLVITAAMVLSLAVAGAARPERREAQAPDGAARGTTTDGAADVAAAAEAAVEVGGTEVLSEVPVELAEAEGGRELAGARR